MTYLFRRQDNNNYVTDERNNICKMEVEPDGDQTCNLVERSTLMIYKCIDFISHCVLRLYYQDIT